jgi:hypothetical protein
MFSRLFSAQSSIFFKSEKKSPLRKILSFSILWLSWLKKWLNARENQKTVLFRSGASGLTPRAFKILN